MTNNSFFKYHKANDHLYELLINRSLFCCSRFNLNDPHDGYYVFSENFKLELAKKLLPEITKKIKDQGVDVPINQDLIIEMARKVVSEKEFFELMHNKENGEILNVCSFSKKGDNELLWAHYADNFKGVCLEFDFSSHPNILELFTEVEYSNKTPEIDSYSVAEVKKAMSSKREAWSYEDEWRILIPDKTRIIFEPIHLKAIWFGPKTPPVKINSIMKLCKEYELKDVKFKKLNIEINGIVL